MNKKKKENRYRPRKNDVAVAPFDFMGHIEVGLKVITIIIVITLTTLFFIFVENAATQSKLFSLVNISVSGNQKLTKDSIIEYSGITERINILDLNLGHLKKRLISHPWIDDASVTRIMPSGLEIKIKEQQPLAVVRIDDKADIIINTKGEPFVENDGIGNEVYNKNNNKEKSKSIKTKELNNTIKPLPVIHGLKLSMDENNHYHFSGKLHECVMQLLKMEKKEVIQSISADNETGIEILTMLNQNHISLQPDQTPVKIKLGFDNFKEKFKKIRHLVKYMQKNNFNKLICSIDLINPENIVIQVKNGDALPES
ncbi:putative FtsQ [Desulfamplus magnetovallimortis]|uniref:Putative FtsQ n=1 Tax=Desulfamplus magnetovallimortis TaxID=1246637 RepID=A0A1W1HE19_9BACT|nr:FtsQ-type POTRA domain-containing protein [Desulfamplus magnetovallimortis]SLM30683.1 putative FtsQ [Desulfamplus magnetovallimortis]